MENQTNTGEGSVPTPQDPNKMLPPAHKNLFAVLSYLGPLVIISLLAGGKEDSFTKFHIKQGLVLFTI